MLLSKVGRGGGWDATSCQKLIVSSVERILFLSMMVYGIGGGRERDRGSERERWRKWNHLCRITFSGRHICSGPIPHRRRSAARRSSARRQSRPRQTLPLAPLPPQVKPLQTSATPRSPPTHTTVLPLLLHPCRWVGGAAVEAVMEEEEEAEAMWCLWGGVWEGRWM